MSITTLLVPSCARRGSRVTCSLLFFTACIMAVQVPNAWREDPKWKGPQGAGNRKGYAHKADYPSRWIPAKGRRHASVDDYDGLESQQAGDIWVMDYLLVPKVRPRCT